VDIKSFKTPKGAEAGLKRAGLAQLPHEAVVYDARGSKGWTCKVTVELAEDADEVRSRGFIPVVKSNQPE
jgi:hypothetical protein